MADTAVVILNYNGVDYLKKFLSGVTKYSSGADIIVADNCSNDDSVKYIRSDHPKVQIIELEENYGFTGGYNRVIALLEHDYCVLLNSDIEVTENWLTPLVSFMKDNPNVAACQPKILDFNNPDWFEYAGAAGGFIDAFGFPYCRGRVFETLEKDAGQYNTTLQVFWATGACMLVNVKDYLNAGGLDEDFFAHMEEIDLCWRFHNLGKQVYCLPQSKVYHVGGGTLAKTNPRKTYLNFRNNLSMLIKNESTLPLLFKLPIKLMLDWLAAVKFGMNNSKEHFFAVIKAHTYTLKHLSTNWNKRKTNKTRRSKNNFSRPALIAFDYFILGRKTFEDLHK